MQETLTKSGMINSLETNKQTPFLKAFQNEFVTYDNKESKRHQSLASAKRGSDLEMTLKNELDGAKKDDLIQTRSGESMPAKFDIKHSSQKKFDIKIVRVSNERPFEGQN